MPYENHPITVVFLGVNQDTKLYDQIPSIFVTRFTRGVHFWATPTRNCLSFSHWWSVSFIVGEAFLCVCLCYRVVVFRRRSKHTDRNVESLTTGSFQNLHNSKKISTWCYRKPYFFILPPCKVSNPTYFKSRSQWSLKYAMLFHLYTLKMFSSGQFNWKF